MSDLNKRRTRGFNSETDLRPPPTGHADWREELQRFLITGRTTGRKQTDIVERLQNWATSDLILDELNALRAEEKVQKFRPPSNGRGRSPTIWRATTKLLE